MQKSETIGELAAALAKAQGQMVSAKKDAANPFFKSKYADLSAIVDAIKNPLSTNGIAYVQTTDTDEAGVIVETTLMHASGEWLSGVLRMPLVKNDPQGVGSAITYARRYGLQAIVGLDADDDDGNAASGNAQATPKAAPKPAAQPAPSTAPSPAELLEIERLVASILLLYPQVPLSEAQINKDSLKKDGVAIWTEASLEYLRGLEKRLKDQLAEKAKQAV